MNSIEYIELISEKLGGASDYKIAQTIGVSKQAISTWRRGREMDTYACCQVADFLGIEPMKIIADIEEKKARNEDKKEYWRELSGRAACAVLALPFAIEILQFVYYVK